MPPPGSMMPIDTTARKIDIEGPAVGSGSAHFLVMCRRCTSGYMKNWMILFVTLASSMCLSAQDINTPDSCAEMTNSASVVSDERPITIREAIPQKTKNSAYQILQVYPENVTVIKEYYAPAISQFDFELILQAAPYPDEPINYLVKFVATIESAVGDGHFWSDISEKRYAYLRLLFSKYEKHKTGGWYAFDLLKIINGKKYYIFSGTKPDTALVIFPDGNLYRGKVGDLRAGWPEYHGLAMRKIEKNQL
jgi:hypothetical protein